jgi:hypothetical protein
MNHHDLQVVRVYDLKDQDLEEFILMESFLGCIWGVHSSYRNGKVSWYNSLLITVMLTK